MDPIKSNPEVTEERVNEEGEESTLLQGNQEQTEQVEQNAETIKLTFLQRLKLIKDNITVEPVVVCYVIACMIPSLATQNLYLEKACRVNLNYSAEICDALTARQPGNYTHEEQEVQKVTANVTMWKNIVQTVFPVLIMLFIGAWSDKTGKRKAIMLIPIAGEILSNIGLMLSTYFFYLPLELTAFTDVIFTSLTGGGSTMNIGIYSYMSDITTVDDRTFRMGILNMCRSVGYPIGTASSGLLFQSTGYYGVFAVSSCIHLISLIYGYLRLKDVRRTERKITQPQEKKSCCREFFDISLVADTFMVVFRKGPNNRRLMICLLLLIMVIVYGPMVGEGSIMYLFVRYKFRWDDVQFSLWSTYVIITNLIGTLLALTLFINFLKMSDPLLGIIANVSKITGAFAYAFAMNTWQMYLAPTIDMFSKVTYVAMLSIATKVVDGQEFGKLNSIFGLIEVGVPLIYGPLFIRVYTSSLDVFPGAVFLLGAFLTLPGLAIFMWMYIQHKRGKLYKETMAEKGVNRDAAEEHAEVIA